MLRVESIRHENPVLAKSEGGFARTQTAKEVATASPLRQGLSYYLRVNYHECADRQKPREFPDVGIVDRDASRSPIDFGNIEVR